MAWLQAANDVSNVPYEVRKWMTYFWEVDNEVPSDDANNNGDDTLHNEDPSPSSKTSTEVRHDLGVLLGGAEVLAQPGSSLNTVASEERKEVTENTGEGR
jgi:hypothetical protein